jgi:hypothetical protein
MGRHPSINTLDTSKYQEFEGLSIDAKFMQIDEICVELFPKKGF